MKKLKMQFLPVFVFAIGLLMISCNTDEEMEDETSNLELSISGLENLGADYVY